MTTQTYFKTKIYIMFKPRHAAIIKSLLNVLHKIVKVISRKFPWDPLFNRIGLYANRMFTTESYWRIPGKFREILKFTDFDRVNFR